MKKDIVNTSEKQQHDETPRLADCNVAVIVGELVGRPTIRELASGTRLASFSLTVRATGERTTSVPLVWFDPPQRVERWNPGDQIAVRGPVVRRFYRAGGATGSATEVNVADAQLVRHRARTVGLLARVAGELERTGGVVASATT